MGAGPCLRAHDDGVAIAFDEALIARNWPDLHTALVGGTPFHAVLSVPLLPPLGPLVVLDLDVRDAGTLPATDRDDFEDVTIAPTRAMVAAALGAPMQEGRRGWWDGPDARQRAQVLAGHRDGRTWVSAWTPRTWSPAGSRSTSSVLR